MSTIRRIVVVLAFLSLLSAAAQDRQTVSTSERGSIEKAVLEASAQMTQAAQALDVERLFGFVLDSDKGPIIQNGRLLLTRKDALEQVSRGFRGISKIEYSWKQQHVSVLSPTVAVLAADGESTATTEQGETFTTPFAQTVVFVLRDGRWKVFHAHQSSPVRR